MTEVTTVARPYAQAVFRLASEAGRLDVWSGFLSMLARVIADPRAREVIADPRNPRQRVAEFLLSVAGEGADEAQRNFVHLLIQQHRIQHAGKIAELFESLRAEAENYIDVAAIAAYPLTDGEREQLTAALERRFEKRVRLSASEDRSLIGGAIIRAGSQVFDGSIRGRLQRLHKSLCS